MSRIPLILTYHPLNTRIQRVHRQKSKLQHVQVLIHVNTHAAVLVANETELLGRKDRLTIKDSFTCLSSCLIYCISCGCCLVIYIGETRRTLKERFGEDLRSINKSAPGFPVAEHFRYNGHTAADALVRGSELCDGSKQWKKQEMRLIFRLGTCQPRGLNADFTSFKVRARAKRNFQILNSVPGIVV